MNPQDRLDQEAHILEKATGHFEFFEKYRQTKGFKDANISYKCCKAFTYKYVKANDVIFKQGKEMDTKYWV